MSAWEEVTSYPIIITLKGDSLVLLHPYEDILVDYIALTTQYLSFKW